MTDTRPLHLRYRPQTFEQVIGHDAQIEALMKVIKRKSSHAFLFIGPSGVGKEQPLTARVLTPSGWVFMGDLQVGDEVCGSDGNAYAVEGIYPQGKTDVYRITFQDGTTVECGNGHLWTVYSKRRGWITRTTGELLSTRQRYKIPLPAEPFVFSSGAALPIDPYVLGVLIGDGYLTGNCVAFSVPSNKEGIKQNIAARLKSPYELSGPGGSDESPQWRIIGGQKNRTTFQSLIQQLGLAVKSKQRRLPGCYLHIPVSDRLDLLRGLMDTDGHANQGRTSFSSCSRDLATDVCWLVRSLGGVAIMKIHDRAHQNKPKEYEVNVRIKACPFTLAYKAVEWKSPSLDYGKRMVSIKLVGKAEQQCIKVGSPDALYVTDGFNLTHNTTLARITARELGVTEAGMHEIDGATFTSVDDMREIGRLATFKSLLASSKAILVDECHRVSAQGFDSLLKAIEEPPPNTYWLFCTTEAAKVKETIRTRCTIVNLKPLSRAQVKDVLGRVTNEEALKIPKGTVDLIATEAGGSIRQALVMLDQARDARDLNDVADAIESAIDDPKVIELCRWLIDPRPDNWEHAMKLCGPLMEQGSESVRNVVCAYFLKALVGAKQNRAPAYLSILQEFADPWPSQDRGAALVLAVGRYFYARRRG